MLVSKQTKNTMLLFCSMFFGWQTAAHGCDKAIKAQVYMQLIKTSAQSLYALQDISEHDQLLQEIYQVRDLLYKKIILFVVLYYCESSIVGGDVLYNEISAQISSNALRMIKLLAQYLPALWKDTKVPWATKMRHIIAIGSVMVLLAKWLKTMGMQAFDTKKTCIAK